MSASRHARVNTLLLMVAHLCIKLSSDSLSRSTFNGRNLVGVIESSVCEIEIKSQDFRNCSIDF